MAARSAFLRTPAPLVRHAIKTIEKVKPSIAEKLRVHYFEPHTIPWRLAQGETTLRLQYPLTSSSVVYHLGVPEQAWADAIRKRYGCEVHVVDALEPEGKEIDLVSMRMEGKEYEALEEWLRNGSIQKIKNIQVQFDKNVPDALARMRAIRKKLRETHAPTYQYDFVWENWERKE